MINLVNPSRYLIKKSLLILIFLLILISCHKNKRNNLTTIIYFDIEVEKPQMLSKICDTITYLRLETKEESLLGQIQKMRFSDSGYYFLTGFNQEKVVGFDKTNGKHRVTINKNGKGPGEYIYATELFVDPNNNFLEIYSRGTKRIINYNIDGNFNNDEKVDQYVNSFIKLNNNYYAAVEEDKNKKIIFFSGKNQFFSVLFTLPDYNINDINNFSQFGDTVSFGCSINKYIYHLVKEESYIRYELNFGKYDIPNKLLDNNSYDYQRFKKVLAEHDCAYNLFSTFESNRFLITTVNFRKQRYLAVYCKETGNSSISNTIIDNINGVNQEMKIGWDFSPLALDNDELIFTLEPRKFKKDIHNQIRDHPNEINISLMNLLSTIEDSDNPLIMRCKLKNF